MVDAIKIEVLEREVSQKIGELQNASKDLGPVLSTIGRKILTRVQLGFRKSVDPYGIAWAALKSRKGKTLVDTARLLRSITYAVSDDSVEIGTNLNSNGVSYPAVHQFGARINIPARAHRIYRSLLKSGDFARGGKFVKKNKANFASNANIPAHSITIPARPFLPIKGREVVLPEDWAIDVLKSVKQHFKLVNAA